MFQSSFIRFSVCEVCNVLWKNVRLVEAATEKAIYFPKCSSKFRTSHSQQREACPARVMLIEDGQYHECIVGDDHHSSFHHQTPLEIDLLYDCNQWCPSICSLTWYQ